MNVGRVGGHGQDDHIEFVVGTNFFPEVGVGGIGQADVAFLFSVAGNFFGAVVEADEMAGKALLEGVVGGEADAAHAEDGEAFFWEIGVEKSGRKMRFNGGCSSLR